MAEVIRVPDVALAKTSFLCLLFTRASSTDVRGQLPRKKSAEFSMSLRPLAPKARRITKTKHGTWVCCAYWVLHSAAKSPKEDMATIDNKVSLDMPEPLVDCAVDP